MNKCIDLGSHMLDGLDALLSHQVIDNSYAVYCFEANPYVYSRSLDRVEAMTKKFSKFMLYNIAVGNDDGIINLNVEENKVSNACNILETPPNTDVVYGAVFNWSQIPVRSICAQTLLHNCGVCEEDSVVIKCDIEGAEFAFLNDLLQIRDLSPIKKMFIEWHERFWFPHHQQMVEEKTRLIGELTKRNISVVEWH